ncbi:UDP-N-acetylmuramate--L-alanine ligase [bacterium]|nr:UDP-N-acetylmuramate--L-alanine ligase [bacterium]
MLDLRNIKKVHFIGIGGVSLSSLALLMRENNVAVSGSDRSFSNKLLILEEHGCTVWVGTDVTKINNVDLVVFSSAIPADNEELVFCKVNNIPCMERYIFLGEAAALFDSTIAVAGTHGKTTVTGMIICVMKKSSLPFCGHIGGDIKDIGNFYYSGKKYFVTEACEYRKSLLSLKPKIALVLNAENDHPDTYKNLGEIYDTFDSFFDNTSQVKITNGDTPYYKARQKHNQIITYGQNIENQYVISNVNEYKKGYFEFSLARYGIPKGTIKLNIAGIHNIYNAAACFVVCDLIGIDNEVIKQGIHEFCGVDRRFQHLGYFLGASVIIDYAHHPSQIEVEINTAKSLLENNRNLFVVFQPHTFSRTAKLFNEFCSCLTPCDELIICKEYSAREKPSDGVSAIALYEKIPHKNKYYYNNIMDIATHLAKKAQAKDIILILGAGDIDNLGSIITAN